MNNSQLAKIIKSECKEKNISVTKLLSDCGIRKSLIYDLEKRDFTPSVAIVEQIADYFGVSVDYLLGRTKDSTAQVNAVIGTVSDNQGNGNGCITVMHTATQEKPSESEQLVALINELSMVDRAKVIVMIDQLRQGKEG